MIRNIQPRIFFLVLKTFLLFCLRWVLCANHTEPVKGFLGRFLRRKLIETEISGRMRNAELVKIIDWIPKVWQHLNKFLEAHSSSDVTIGKCSAHSGRNAFPDIYKCMYSISLYTKCILAHFLVLRKVIKGFFKPCFQIYIFFLISDKPYKKFLNFFPPF